MPLSDAEKKAQKKYNQKCINFSVSYKPAEVLDGERVKKYLTSQGITANAYIKELIKKDLDNKDFR